MDSYQEEDPGEVYRREFQRKRWEKEQAAKASTEQGRKNTHRYFRYLAFPAALFAVLVLIDKYIPGTSYTEVPQNGWQERGPRTKYRAGAIISYMETEHFEVVVPSKIHINYPYNEVDRPPLTVTVSPIFKIPSRGSMTLDKNYYTFSLGNTIHTMTYLVWALLISSLATILIRKYSWYTYCFAYVPALLFLGTLLKVFL